MTDQDREIETRRFAVAFLGLCLLFAVVGTVVSMIAH
jgi:hypothetical protein